MRDACARARAMGLLAAAIVTFLIPFGASRAAAIEPAAIVLSSPFVTSRAAHAFYRVPSIIKNSQGALLVFAERRNNADGADDGDFDIVMRKSTDGGRTWGPIKTVANDGRSKVSSPVSVLDPLTGDVLLICIVRHPDGEYVGHFLQRSTDGGNTFTPLGAGRLGPQSSWIGRPGPGHAIVLKNGSHAGRIVLATGGSNGVHGVFSDDGGRTWKAGYSLSNASDSVDYVEGTIAELPNGALFVSYRDGRATKLGMTRRYAYSFDGGASLAAPLAPLSGVRIPSVEGSTLSAVGTHSGDLLLSAPSYTSASVPSRRRDMSIFVSQDGGATWGAPYPVDLESKAASYSDLVQMDDATVGILYETGRYTWQERIAFRTVRMSALTDPVKVASSLKAKLSARTVRASQHAGVSVVVAVRGIVRPLGRVVVTFTRGAVSGSASVTLNYTDKGKHRITLPKLGRGTYAISVTYRGAVRIAARTVSAGSLHVK